MLGQARIGTKTLANLCRRLAISLSAGVDVRNVWARETNHAHGAARRHFKEISSAVARGSSIGDALDQSGNYFPEFFREMVRVGEESGNLPEVFRQLAENYEHQLQMRRTLIGAITWPLIELTLALGVVGLLIYVMGAVPQLAKSNIDLLGLGLRGTSGLAIYLAVLAVIAAIGVAIYRAAVRGALWIRPVQLVLMRVPQLGKAMETFALARLTWAMHVTLNSGMELRKALSLSLRSTHNVVYSQHVDRVLRSIRSGNEIHEALDATRAFPPGFVDAVEVGEQSGMLSETMANLSNQYQAEARMAMNVITAILGFLVFVLIAMIIIFFIYQIFTNAYLGPINDALKPI
jgi:type II secretory pathway component PulF